MKIHLKRTACGANSTPGLLSIDGVFECHTLEDLVRDHKIDGCTAIPAGEYEVDITMSTRFKRLLPLLLNVPNYTGVRIHPGNTSADTEGCILVGDSPGPDFLGESRIAFNRLFPKLLAARERHEPITITIEN